MIEAILAILEVYGAIYGITGYVYKLPKCKVCVENTKQCLRERIEYRMANYEKCQ